LRRSSAGRSGKRVNVAVVFPASEAVPLDISNL
jgi:hypothetical protein